MFICVCFNRCSFFLPPCGRVITSRTSCKQQIITFTFVLLQTVAYLNRKHTQPDIHRESQSRPAEKFFRPSHFSTASEYLTFFFLQLHGLFTNFVRKPVAVPPCSFVAQISSYVLIVDMFTREFNNIIASS